MTQTPRRIATIGAAIPVAIGVTVMAGWALDVEALRRMLLSPVIMIPNTAIGMIAAGMSLLLLREPPHDRPVAKALGAFVFLLGLTVLTERIGDVDFGIDLLLFANGVRAYPFLPPGRFATNTALCFTLAGAALIAMTSAEARLQRTAHWFATAGLGVASLALIGYLFGAKPLYTLDQVAGMAQITAIGFAALNTGILFTFPSQGFVSLIVTRDLAGNLIRRILPAAVAVPLVLGWLWLKARERAMVSVEGGVALFALLVVAVTVTLVVRAAFLLRNIDSAREGLLVREANLRQVAEQASEAKSTFLATMSHELRTPLNAIIGYTSLMIDGIPEPVTIAQRQRLTRVEASARHLLSLIEDVLTVSHMDVGQQRITFGPVQLGTVIADSLSIAQPMAALRHLTIDADVRDAEVMIETDPVRLRQVLLNLIVNAIKFTDEGTIGVSARVNGDAIISIRDTGIGIAREHMDRVFEPFWQVQQTRTRLVGGSGLGLTVSRRLIGLMGGELTVASELNVGTTFTVRLPRPA